ncbi:hypothetical protein GQ44DRAFT_727935 [Phaeosphaeriaceae sp. PMI808]|nr:hypothetical protein GQ44DRAFT_727935 [Phaeosphaeriaceae sp. PMI808]
MVPRIVQYKRLPQTDLQKTDSKAVYVVLHDIHILWALTTEPPFPKGLASYSKGTSPFPEHILSAHNITETGYDFTRRLLRPLPSDRLTAIQALEHRWIASQMQPPPRSLSETQDRKILPDGSFSGGAASFSALEVTQKGPSLSTASACWSTTQSSIGEKTKTNRQSENQLKPNNKGGSSSSISVNKREKQTSIFSRGRDTTVLGEEICNTTLKEITDYSVHAQDTQTSNASTQLWTSGHRDRTAKNAIPINDTKLAKGPKMRNGPSSSTKTSDAISADLSAESVDDLNSS